MKEGIKILAAISEDEKETFLPEGLWKEISEFPGFKWIKTPLEEKQEWERILLGFQPEVLICCWSTPPLPLELKDRLDLKYACNLSGSVRKWLPLEYIEEGLLVTNWGDSISRVVAECSLMLILMSLRKATHWSLQMHVDKKWKAGGVDNRSLFERRVGLHGLGAISRALVNLLKPFNTEITAYSPSVPDDIFRGLGVKRADSLESLFSGSDVLVELAAATERNRRVVDERILRLLPEDAVFVNVGRGMVVDERALEKVAKEGRIRIGLDVYEKEPLPEDSPLRGLRNVTLLPHIGGNARDRRRDAGEVAVENLMKYIKGHEPDFIVDEEVYSRIT